MYKKAFTLAEVLITLGILAVVAAMTIPTLIGNYKKKQAVTQLKKVYSSLLQSIEISKIKSGDIADWNWNLDAYNFFIQYLAANFQVVQNCGNNSGCWYSKGTYMLKGGVFDNTPLKNYWYKILLSDGTFIALEKQDNTHVHIAVDINGEKAPNTYGKDVFMLTFTSIPLSDEFHNITVPGLFMYGHGLNAGDIKTSSFGCSKYGAGLMCGEKILMDSWQIKDDYPW